MMQLTEIKNSTIQGDFLKFDLTGKLLTLKKDYRGNFYPINGIVSTVSGKFIKTNDINAFMILGIRMLINVSNGKKIYEVYILGDQVYVIKTDTHYERIKHYLNLFFDIV